MVRPDDDKRHPLAAFIEGTPEFSPRPMLFVGRELARRGWTTVAVMRPGYGQSQGKEPGEGRCDHFEAQAVLAAQTLRETIRFMGQKPYIDPSRAIAIGHSTGGLGAIALTADPPPNLVAAISFAGNNGSLFSEGKLDTVCNAKEVVRAFAALGRKSRVPTLWVYAENDHHMGVDLARKYHDAFTGAGGRAVFDLAPATGKDGHLLYAMPDAVAIWSPYLDRFLNDLDLNLISPPMPLVAPAIVPPSQLTASGRAAFSSYLLAIPHKAFAASLSRWGDATMADSTGSAIAKALANCKGTPLSPCKVLMIDDVPVPENR